MLNISSKNCSVMDSNGATLEKPALTNKIFNLPFSFSTIWTTWSRSVNFVESARMAVTFFSSSCLTAASSASWRRPVIKTYAPSARNSCAVAKPIPSDPPVISATFPSSLPVSNLIYRAKINHVVACLQTSIHPCALSREKSIESFVFFYSFSFPCPIESRMDFGFVRMFIYFEYYSDPMFHVLFRLLIWFVKNEKNEK